jgi:hypothetical protein
MGEGLYDTRFRARPKPKTKQTTAIRNPPRVFQLPDSDASPSRAACASWRFFSACQLPVFDASILNPICFLFSEFCLLFPRRQNPVVDFGVATEKLGASEIGR